MTVLLQAKTFARSLRRSLGISPIQRVLKELRAEGIDISSMRSLEVFGYQGNMHTKDYAGDVASLEVWEINPRHEHALRANLPRAHVKITDSYMEIKSSHDKFGMVVIDNSPVHPPYIEHFDLFPYVLDLAGDQIIMIINVIPEISRDVARMYPEMLKDEVLERRKMFYGVESSHRIPLDRIVARYRSILQERGFSLERYFTQRRNKIFQYLVLVAARMRSVGEESLNGLVGRGLL